jgi:hypothetical protein
LKDPRLILTREVWDVDELVIDQVRTRPSALLRAVAKRNESVKGSRLLNLVNAVKILDEAQIIPLPLLRHSARAQLRMQCRTLCRTLQPLYPTFYGVYDGGLSLHDPGLDKVPGQKSSNSCGCNT